jgi:hypothetical protein
VHPTRHTIGVLTTASGSYFPRARAAPTIQARSTRSMFLLQPGERGRADSPVIYRVPPVPASLGPPAAEKNLPRPRAGRWTRGRTTRVPTGPRGGVGCRQGLLLPCPYKAAVGRGTGTCSAAVVVARPRQGLPLLSVSPRS